MVKLSKYEKEAIKRNQALLKRERKFKKSKTSSHARGHGGRISL